MSDIHDEAPLPAATTAVKRHSTFGTESEDEAAGRERWPSRFAFYLAAVGSAVGFGNVWRFPALAKDYGGGAFFIPYLMALFLIGIPVLVLEISLGQVRQVGNIGVWGTFHPRVRGVGMASVVCAFILVTYYSMLLAWVTNAFFDSFSDEAKEVWTGEGASGEEAVNYFYNEIIGMGSLGSNLRPTRLVGNNVGYAALVWFCVWLCLAFGTKWTGRIAYFTMGLPILLLVIFFGKSISLTGASAGIEEYIGLWDMGVLTEQPDVWSTAVSQIFFSLSVTFGTMTAYGSHCPKGEPAFWNSTVIGLSNSMFSFVSGFAVFASMGHLAYVQGVPVDDIPYRSFALVFGTWPVVFGTLEGGIHWVRLLFFNLFLLGIDSAFSILESPIIIAVDWFTKSGKEVAKWKISGIFSIVAFLFSLVYATDAGLIFLDSVDFYINFILLLIGFMETFSAGWVYNIEQQIKDLGPAIVFTWMFTNFGSIIVACAVWFGLNNKNEVWAGFVSLFVCFLAGTAATGYLCNLKIAREPEKWDWSSIIYEVGLKNVMDLREELESICGFMPGIWAIMMKMFCPHALLILFINLAQSENKDGDALFGNYEGYVTFPFQFIGFVIVALAGMIIVLGGAWPQVLEGGDLTVGYEPNTNKVKGHAENEENIQQIEDGTSADFLDDEKQI